MKTTMFPHVFRAQFQTRRKQELQSAERVAGAEAALSVAAAAVKRWEVRKTGVYQYPTSENMGVSPIGVPQ